MEHSLHTLYFSEQCPHCKKLLQMLHDIPSLNNVTNKLSIHADSVPTHIKNVPSLMRNNTQLITGRDVFEWVNTERDVKIDAFDSGPGGEFSYIASDGFMEKNQNFTF